MTGSEPTSSLAIRRAACTTLSLLSIERGVVVIAWLTVAFAIRSSFVSLPWTSPSESSAKRGRRAPGRFETAAAGHSSSVRPLTHPASPPTRTRGSETAEALPTLLVMRSADRLRLRRSALAKVDREDDHRADGEKLGLPVLERPLPEVGVDEIATPGDRRLVVLALLLVEQAPVVQRLRGPRGEEDCPHDDQQRVLVDAPAQATDLRPPW